MELHSGDSEHRLSIHVRVIEPIQKMNSSRTGSCNADAEPARKFRVAARHESGGFFMPDLYELDLVHLLSKRLNHAVDAVAWYSENRVHAPLHECLDNN